MPQNNLSMTQSQNTPTSFCFVKLFIHLLAGRVHPHPCWPVMIPPGHAIAAAPRTPNISPDPSHASLPPPPSPGHAWASQGPNICSCWQYHLTAQKNLVDSQWGFQFPSATHQTQIQLCLPTWVSKTHSEIWEGILFPANNYPVFMTLPFHPQIMSITNTAKSSGFADWRAPDLKWQIYTQKPVAVLGFWGTALLRQFTHDWQGHLSSIPEVHPAV